MNLTKARNSDEDVGQEALDEISAEIDAASEAVDRMEQEANPSLGHEDDVGSPFEGDADKPADQGGDSNAAFNQPQTDDGVRVHPVPGADGRVVAMAFEEEDGAMREVDTHDVVLPQTKSDGSPGVADCSVVRMDPSWLQGLSSKNRKFNVVMPPDGKEVTFRPETGKEFLVRNNVTGTYQQLTHEELEEGVKNADEMLELHGKQVVQTNGLGALLIGMADRFSKSPSSQKLADIGAKSASNWRRSFQQWPERSVSQALNARDNAQKQFQSAYQGMMKDANIKEKMEALDGIEKEITRSGKGKARELGAKAAKIRQDLRESFATANGGQGVGENLDQMRAAMDKAGDASVAIHQQLENNGEHLNKDEINHRLSEFAETEDMGRKFEKVAERSGEKTEEDESRIRRIREMAEKAKEVLEKLMARLTGRAADQDMNGPG